MQTLNDTDLAIHMPELKKAALILRAINHPLRQQMMRLLHGREKMAVTELYIKMRLEQSVASQHLAILRKSGLVLTTREGKFVFYSVHYEKLVEVHQTASQLIAKQ